MLICCLAIRIIRCLSHSLILEYISKLVNLECLNLSLLLEQFPIVEEVPIVQTLFFSFWFFYLKTKAVCVTTLYNLDIFNLLKKRVYAYMKTKFQFKFFGE